jgi:hypothetical protein
VKESVRESGNMLIELMALGLVMSQTRSKAAYPEYYLLAKNEYDLILSSNQLYPIRQVG